MDRFIRHFIEGFQSVHKKRLPNIRRIGAELKFPFVNDRGEAGSQEGIGALWKFLENKGWTPSLDPVSRCVVGASTPGPKNDTVASSETGFCKTEFALAHVADLHELAVMLRNLRNLLHEFSEEYGYLFLGYGIQPMTSPGKHLEMKKSRNIFWDRIFGSNRHIDPEDGDDVHLFTVSASSQVHIDVSLEEAIKAVNMFNGFSGAQIALTANSNIWKNNIDPKYKCVGEMFWDWWIPNTDRYGVPSNPFTSLEDYVQTIVSLPPVYVRRKGLPIGLLDYDSFYDYYCSEQDAVGIDSQGEKVTILPEPADIDQHSTFYWYNARISRYYTLENRVCDQQPPEDLLCIAALTLGLTSALDQGHEEIQAYDWENLRKARVAACEKALQAQVDGRSLADLAGRMLDVAEAGLKNRGLGEEVYLSPLRARQIAHRCPADAAAQIYNQGGISALLKNRRI